MAGISILTNLYIVPMTWCIIWSKAGRDGRESSTRYAMSMIVPSILGLASLLEAFTSDELPNLMFHAWGTWHQMPHFPTNDKLNFSLLQSLQPDATLLDFLPAINLPDAIITHKRHIVLSCMCTKVTTIQARF